MPLSPSLFSSEKQDWETPPAFFERLDKEFCFTFDVCASALNTKCQDYLSLERGQDALVLPWPKTGWCWMNPPYGKNLGKWIAKAYEESLSGSKVACLIPARTDTRYWHNHCMKAFKIYFVKGRLQFVGASGPAPFPSCLVFFSPLSRVYAVRHCPPWPDNNPDVYSLELTPKERGVAPRPSKGV